MLAHPNTPSGNVRDFLCFSGAVEDDEVGIGIVIGSEFLQEGSAFCVGGRTCLGLAGCEGLTGWECWEDPGDR